MNPNDRLERLADRITRLEKSNRMLMTVSFILFATVIAVVSIAWSAGKSGDEIEDTIVTRNLKVVDESGQAFIEMSVDSLFGPEILLYGESGNVQVEMTAWPEGLGGMLNFYDEDGDRALEVGYVRGWDAGFKLNDWDGTTRAMLTFWGGSSPRLTFHGPDDEVADISLGILENGEPEFGMFDDEGDTLFSAP